MEDGWKVRMNIILLYEVLLTVCCLSQSEVSTDNRKVITTVHNLLFCARTLCMNYVTNTFLLVSSSVRSKQLLCFLHGQGQKREQKPTTKKVVGLHNHSPLLTMIEQIL